MKKLSCSLNLFVRALVIGPSGASITSLGWLGTIESTKLDKRKVGPHQSLPYVFRAKYDSITRV